LTPLKPNALVVKFHALIIIIVFNGAPSQTPDKATLFSLEKSF
jgi:hypothetical protein